ncbi:histidine kinase [Streptomyces sp. Vc74B-19]|uniref:histidine kinase n=1 Tax=Streptomyces sp. Vc74B-19 TaxID=2741324 RepID=UPI00203D82FD|nr:histidine kinase [Streptomyces sp. Vc74B-19]
MKRNDDRLVPVLLLCAQALVWPGAALVRGDVPSASALLVAALVAGSVTAVLTLRRSRPVAALVVVAAACALGAGPLPAGATAVLGTAGVALALWTVATGRDTFTTLLCGTSLAVWQLVHGLTLHRLSDRDGLDLVLTALLYATTCGAGLFARRARRTRQANEHLLRRAESERHRLPAVERRRMERELHDVSAHHLTAVVVTAGAALGLRETRPELADEALRFAVETGHEVTRALGAVRAPAPSAAGVPSPEERLLGLVAGFRRIGQPVDCEIDPLPEGAVADAAYGIVREALTNGARYAPGAPTRVRCRYGDDRTDVVVTSGAPLSGAPAHGADLGGGRGQGILRSRAREAGGTLTTGPTADGGWEVRAVLPGRTAGPADGPGARGHRVAQVTAAAGLVLQPLLPVVAIRAEDTEPGSSVSAGVLFALLAAAQAVTLLWLRRAPRTAYGALAVLALLWPVAAAAGDYGGPVLLPSALGAVATCVALAVDGAVRAGGGWPRSSPRPFRAPVGQPTQGRGYRRSRRIFRAPVGQPTQGRGELRERSRRSRRIFGAPVGQPTQGRGELRERSRRSRGRLLTFPYPLAGAITVHTAAVTAAVLQRGTGLPASAVVVAALAGTVPVTYAAHRVGTARGRRAQDARTARDGRLGALTGEAVRDAWAERRRIAGGLETTVLARTADMVAEAEAGRLDATAERAREALAVMRALLDTVRDDEERPALRPQPTLQALDLLARQCRATGREVDIRLTGRVPERLPAAVDLAAYHAAETVLATGGEHPAALELDSVDGTLTITATGVPSAAHPAVRERLAARVEALDGTLTTGPADTVRLLLPLAPGDGKEGER